MTAARDAILYQTDNKNLMKIISEDINFDDNVKYGLAMEQGSRKVEQMRNQSSWKEDEHVTALEEKVRALWSKDRSAKKVSCLTCTRTTHEEGKCRGKKNEHYVYRRIGQVKGVTACKTKKESRKSLSHSRGGYKW